MSIVPQLSLPLFEEGKHCSRCREWHPLSNFHKNRSHRDGLQIYCKPCMNMTTAESRSRHMEDVRARSRAERKRFREQNPERAKKEYREWYYTKGQVYHRKHKEQNRERYIENKRKWRAANPDKVQTENAHRSAWRRGAFGQHSSVEWKSLCAKFGGRCLCCGGKVKLTRDHIIPTTDPSCSNEIWNVQPLCMPCNSRKNNRHINYRPDRLLPPHIEG